MTKELLSSNNNDILRNLKGLDKEELLQLIKDFHLRYHDTLFLPPELTFGIEIEYEDLKWEKVEEFINRNNPNWNLKKDASIPLGGEITSPILTDKKEYWQELKNICDFLKKEKANTNKNTGGHVHIGAQMLGNDYNNWRRFIKLYTIYEQILFRFGYGDKLHYRTKILVYSDILQSELISKIWKFNHAKSLREIEEFFPHQTKHIALSFRHVSFADMSKRDMNTIEFRFPNCTVEEAIWQNNINVFAKMILAAKNPNLDEEYLDALLKELEYLFYTFNNFDEIFARYQRIDLPKALEFADLIFNNNLDKINFLRQYLKSYEEILPPREEMTLARYQS